MIFAAFCFVLGCIVGLVVGTYTAVREQARREAFSHHIRRTYGHGE